MERLVSPPKDQLTRLRQPLTHGEKQVFEFFNTHLKKEWEIYIQPHLNGLRPDFVLMHPKAGIAIYEVKDWDLNKLDYQVQVRKEMPPKLLGRKDGITFSLQRDNPFEKVRRYRNELSELYCPRLDRKAGPGITITAGVIFPFAQEAKVKELFGPMLQYRRIGLKSKIFPIVGKESLASNRLNNVFPLGLATGSSNMHPDLAKDLRNWLVEPDFSAEQREPLEIDKKQENLIRTRTKSGYRRITGPAGSGKSLVLAARAAQLASEGKEVLFITYNITLLNYLRDLSVRWPVKMTGHIIWLNFHFWCKRVCQDAGMYDEYDKFWEIYFKKVKNAALGKEEREDVRKALEKDLPSLVIKIIDSGNNYVKTYDAILVDEGQDFLPGWWDALRKTLKNNGEMLLAEDMTQDIYGTAKLWTDDAKKKAGFSGDWSKLDNSYRLPPKAIELANSFAKKYLPEDKRDLPETPEQDLPYVYQCSLRWIQTTEKKTSGVCLKEILSMAPNAEPEILSIPDITFLCGNIDIGEKIISMVEGKGVKAVHTFTSDSRDARRKKMAFFKGVARVKATSMHSFKGWEARAIILYVGPNSRRSASLLYTGLTRIKRHVNGSFLTVICADPELEEFGRTWPEFNHVE